MLRSSALKKKKVTIALGAVQNHFNTKRPRIKRQLSVAFLGVTKKKSSSRLAQDVLMKTMKKKSRKKED